MNTKKIGILGTGIVGKTIGSKLIELGYEVMMGSRTLANEQASEWVKSAGATAWQGTFADAAKFGEVVINCSKGEFYVDVIKSAGEQNLANKTLIDISNPLDFSMGTPPVLMPALCNTNSLGEEIQKMIPATRVVKTLNIVTCEVMVDAKKCGGPATMFIAGNNTDAKEMVKKMLQQFGWTDIIDLGNIKHARSTEMMLPIWLSIYLSAKNASFGFKVVRE